MISLENSTGANQVAHDYITQSGSDQVPDVVMAEVARRLVGTIESNELSNVVFSPTEPPDKTKVWWTTDPVTNVPVGQPKIWSEADNTWVNAASGVAPYVPPKEAYIGIDQVAGASATRNVTIPDMGRQDYFVDVEVNTYVAQSWNAASANMNNFGWQINNKTATQISFSFFNVPTGGLHFDIRVRNRPNT